MQGRARGRRRRSGLIRSLGLLGPLVLLVLAGLAPAASAAPLVGTAVAGQAAGVPGPEVIDRSTIAPILLGTGCAATEVVLPLAGPVTWWLVAGGSVVTVDASQPYGIDPAATTQVRATLSRGARFDDGSTEADWTVGPASADVVTGCTPAPPASSTTSAPKPTTTSTTAPAPTRAPDPTSTAPAGPTGADTTGGGTTSGATGDDGRAVTSGGQATASSSGASGADVRAGGPGGSTEDGPDGGSDASGGTGATDVEASEAPVVLAAPEVETRVLSNSFTRPEVSATAAAVPGAGGDGGATVAPLAGVVALLAASGLVAGLLLYRGARGGRPATHDGATPLA